jgi:hypothetical protein
MLQVVYQRHICEHEPTKFDILKNSFQIQMHFLFFFVFLFFCFLLEDREQPYL